MFSGPEIVLLKPQRISLKSLPRISCIFFALITNFNIFFLNLLLQLPFKKRKISEDKLKQRLNVGDAKLFATDSYSELPLNDNECVQNALLIKSPPLHVTTLPKSDCSKQLSCTKNKSPEKSIKQLSHTKKKSPEKSDKTLSSKLQVLRQMFSSVTDIKKSPVINDLLIPTTIRNLATRFENCINFIRPRRLQNMVDIDSIVRSFSIFGKVVGIQDHWTRPKGKKVCDLSFTYICY